MVITKEKYLDNEKSSNKKELIRKVKQMHSNGTSIREIAREVAISRNTVKKYIKVDDIENIRYNNKPTPVYFYKDFIINLTSAKEII